MAGFNFELGRSNNMVAAEERGMITIGGWAKRHRVSAAAAIEVMRPTEAHHTGTGRRGKSRLTPVIDGATEPTDEQLARMRAIDAGAEQQVRGYYMIWGKAYDGPRGRKRFFPALATFEGPESGSRKLRDFVLVTDDAIWAAALAHTGKDLREFKS